MIVPIVAELGKLFPLFQVLFIARGCVMAVLRGRKRPIAVLCKEIPPGFQFMRTVLKDTIAEVNVPAGEIIDKEGQYYFLVNREEQLMGMEISDFRIVPGFGWKNPNAEAIVRRAKERIRR